MGIPKGTQIVTTGRLGAIRLGTPMQQTSTAGEREKSVLEHFRHFQLHPQNRIDDLGKVAACSLFGRRQAALHVPADYQGQVVLVLALLTHGHYDKEQWKEWW